jgi:hypothetical protein
MWCDYIKRVQGEEDWPIRARDGRETCPRQWDWRTGKNLFGASPGNGAHFHFITHCMLWTGIMTKCFEITFTFVSVRELKFVTFFF